MNADLKKHLAEMQARAMQMGALTTALETMMFEEPRKNLCFHLLDGIKDLAQEINDGLDEQTLTKGVKA